MNGRRESILFAGLTVMEEVGDEDANARWGICGWIIEQCCVEKNPQRSGRRREVMECQVLHVFPWFSALYYSGEYVTAFFFF
jgi:hypothetical protein